MREFFVFLLVLLFVRALFGNVVYGVTEDIPEIIKYDLDKIPNSNVLIARYGRTTFKEMLKKGWLDSIEYLEASPEKREQFNIGWQNKEIDVSYEIIDIAIGEENGGYIMEPGVCHSLKDRKGTVIIINYEQLRENKINFEFAIIKGETIHNWEYFVFDRDWNLLYNKPVVIDKRASSTSNVKNKEE